MVDPEIPSRYIEAHYEPSDRLAVVLINRKTGAIKHEFGSAEFLAGPRYYVDTALDPDPADVDDAFLIVDHLVEHIVGGAAPTGLGHSVNAFAQKHVGRLFVAAHLAELLARRLGIFVLYGQPDRA